MPEEEVEAGPPTAYFREEDADATTGEGSFEEAEEEEE